MLFGNSACYKYFLCEKLYYFLMKVMLSMKMNIIVGWVTTTEYNKTEN